MRDTCRRKARSEDASSKERRQRKDPGGQPGLRRRGQPLSSRHDRSSMSFQNAWNITFKISDIFLKQLKNMLKYTKKIRKW
jgi:hypothetical protein